MGSRYEFKLADVKLGGHSDTVISLYIHATSSNYWLLSGSDDGSVKLWDTNDPATCLHSVVLQEREPVTSICAGGKPDQVFSASASNIYSLIICESSDNGQQIKIQHSLFSQGVNQDEINQLCISLRKNAPYLAAADDTGCIQVYHASQQTDSNRRQLYKSILNKHTTICSAILFPKNSPWCLLSGGYDCQLVSTDFSIGKTLWSLNMQITDKNAPDNQLVNPPFVHSIVMQSSQPKQKRDVALVGLGNGTFFEILVKTGDILVTRENAHASGVIQLLSVNPNLVISLGNDRMIKVWLKEIEMYQLVAEIRHDRKLNAAIIQTCSQGYKLYVADVSSNISIYKLEITSD